MAASTSSTCAFTFAFKGEALLSRELEPRDDVTPARGSRSAATLYAFASRFLGDLVKLHAAADGDGVMADHVATASSAADEAVRSFDAATAVEGTDDDDVARAWMEEVVDEDDDGGGADASLAGGSKPQEELGKRKRKK